MLAYWLPLAEAEADVLANMHSLWDHGGHPADGRHDAVKTARICGLVLSKLVAGAGLLHDYVCHVAAWHVLGNGLIPAAIGPNFMCATPLPK